MKPAVFDTAPAAPTRASAKTRRPRPRGRRDALDVYLDRARHHPRLSAADERAELLALVALRQRRWEVLLGDEPAAWPEVLERIEAELDDAPAEAIERLRASSDRAPSEQAEAVAELAAAIESVDTDGALAERLGRELSQRGRRAAVARATAEYHRARNRFVCANLRLVVMVADRYSGRWMSLADRVQEGNLGLIKAVERFDPERGTRFSTYAVWWIRHAITRALVNRGRTVRVPAHLHVIFTKLRGARPAVEAEQGRAATVAELAKAAGVPLDKAKVAVEAMELRSISLDGPTNEEEGPAWPEVLGESAPQVELDAAIVERRNEWLALRALEQLDERERDILQRRFELGGRTRMTLEALGRCYELSRERVRQLQNRALGSIRREIESSSVTDLAFA